MILRRVYLKNIRSYKEESLQFPIGTTLLAGDIGAGKSTILHAVEFALFGVMRGILSGETLLRFGTNEGSVTLELEIESKQIAIHRSLRRTSTGVGQEKGDITINGVNQALTANELKAQVLGLLGYPSELLTKHKGLIYRYTVYTPQEDMKRILFDEAESRLDTLRMVFNIDKYKRINENAKIYSRFLRERCAQNQGRIADLETKKEQLKQKQQESEVNKQAVEKSRSEMAAAKKTCAEARKELESHEAILKKLTELRQQIAVREHEQRMLISQRMRISQEIQNTQKMIVQIESEQAEKPTSTKEELQEEIPIAEEEARKKDMAIRDLVQKIGMAQAMVDRSSEITNRLIKIATCPTCLQQVTDEHRHSINCAEKEKQEMFLNEALLYKSRLTQIESDKQALNHRIKSLHEGLSKVIAWQTKEEHREGLLQRIEAINKQMQETEVKLSESIAIKKELLKAIFPIEGIEEQIKQFRETYSKAQGAERTAAVVHSRSCGQQEEIERQIASLKGEIEAKIAIKSSLEHDRQILHWTDDGFSKIIMLMEQHVMATVYHQFNDSFSTWFNTLIEDSLMNARLDETFSPVIIQNGYEISPEHLSGGEKTSLALAYRLSLNKVINDIHTSIKTRDIIILDEPTDGFSSEQLDKVRDVIRQLPVKQCILVSHESKIESFVDQVINVEKEGHVSRVGRLGSQAVGP